MIDSCGGLVATSKSTAFFCIYNFGIWIFFLFGVDYLQEDIYVVGAPKGET